MDDVENPDASGVATATMRVAFVSQFILYFFNATQEELMME
jgi:hypothetical protein